MESAKAILICGKICSGKSTYVNRLQKGTPSALLSCDELTLALFDSQLGDRHEEITQKARAYLFQKAAELLGLHVSVILDWGFWAAESRREAEDFFRSRGFETQWHYIEVSDAAWRRNMEKRNREAPAGTYFVDPSIAAKCAALFEPPRREEIDVWYGNG